MTTWSTSSPNAYLYLQDEFGNFVLDDLGLRILDPDAAPPTPRVNIWNSSIDVVGLKRTWGEWASSYWGDITYSLTPTIYITDNFGNYILDEFGNRVRDTSSLTQDTWSNMAGYKFVGSTTPITVWS